MAGLCAMKRTNFQRMVNLPAWNFQMTGGLQYKSHLVISVPYLLQYHTYTLPHPTMPFHTLLYHTLLYHTLLYHTIPYCTILCHTTLHYTILYCTITYHTIPYYTVPCRGISRIFYWGKGWFFNITNFQDNIIITAATGSDLLSLAWKVGIKDTLWPP